MNYPYTLLLNINAAEDPTHIPYLSEYDDGQYMLEIYSGELEADNLHQAAERCFAIHNQHDRPLAKTTPSMSVGDVVVLATPDGSVGMACQRFGWKQVAPPTNTTAELTYEAAAAMMKANLEGTAHVRNA